MNTKTAYAFDEKGVYKGECLAYESPLEPNAFPLPANSTFTIPPVSENPYVPVWTGSEWELIEDHRRHLDDNGNLTGGTPYWLPSDDYRSEARYMKELGPLPLGALLSKPTKPENVIRKESLESELYTLKEWLSEHDYIGTKIATGRATVDEYKTEIAEMTVKAARINEIEAELASIQDCQRSERRQELR